MSKSVEERLRDNLNEIGYREKELKSAKLELIRSCVAFAAFLVGSGLIWWKFDFVTLLGLNLLLWSNNITQTNRRGNE